MRNTDGNRSSFFRRRLPRVSDQSRFSPRPLHTQSNTCTLYISRGPSLWPESTQNLSCFSVCSPIFDFLAWYFLPGFFFFRPFLFTVLFRVENGLDVGLLAKQRHKKARVLIERDSLLVSGGCKCLLWFESKRLPDCYKTKKC